MPGTIGSMGKEALPRSPQNRLEPEVGSRSHRRIATLRPQQLVPAEPTYPDMLRPRCLRADGPPPPRNGRGGRAGIGLRKPGAEGAERAGHYPRGYISEISHFVCWQQRVALLTSSVSPHVRIAALPFEDDGVGCSYL